MAEFVLDNEIKHEEANLVHLLDCTELQTASDTLYLGSYGSPVAAYNIAKGYRYSVDYCPKCLSRMASR